jgi:hypothetical protein
MGARLLGYQHLLPTFLGGWRRRPTESFRVSGPVSPGCASRVAASPSGRGQVLSGVVNLWPLIRQLQEHSSLPSCPHPHSVKTSNPLPTGLLLLPHPCPRTGPSVAHRSVGTAYLAGRVAPAPARLPQPGGRRRFYRRA